MDEDPDDVIELGEPLAYVGDDGMQFTNSDDYYNMVAAMMALGYMPPADFVPDDMMGHPDLEIHLSDHSHSPVIVLSTPLPSIHENQLPSQQPSNDLVNKPEDKPKEKEKNKKSKVKEKKNAAKSTIKESGKKKTKPHKSNMPARSPSYYSSARTRSRGRNRSPYTPYSRSRSRGDSRSRDRYSDTYYSDDSFHSDDSRRGRRKGRSRSPSPRRYHSSVKTAAKKVGAKKTGGVKKSGAATTTPRPGIQDVVTRRMLSARRLKINELKNEIDLLMKQLDEIRRENKSLKRDNVLQTKQLDKFQDQEGELPQLMDSHNKELRSLKEQIRKWRERHDRINKTLRGTEDELSRSQKKVKKLQLIADDKKLEERDELSRRVGRAEQDLDNKNNRIQQLERHIENLEKSHRREITNEMKKHAATKLELDTLQADYEYTKIHLRDREKELEVRNIYQNRISKAKRAGSVASLPALEPPARYQPPPKSPDVSPRRRAQDFEQKRREDQKAKAKEPNVSSFDSPNSASKIPPITRSQPTTSSQPIKHSIEYRSSNDQQLPTHVERVSSKQQPDKKKGAVQRQPVRQQAAVSKKEAPPLTNRRSNEAEHNGHQAAQNSQSQAQRNQPKAPQTPKFETEDSWEAIVKKQQNITGAKSNNAVTKDSLDGSFSKSRDSTFVKAEPSKSFFATEIPEPDAENPNVDNRPNNVDEERARDEEVRRQREEAEERRRRQEEREREEEELKRQRDERDRQERQHRKQRAQEEREEYIRQEQEARDARDREERKAREAAERDRRYQEEAEERARIAREQEKRRLETDARAAEERRKKDLLLQKMKELDTGGAPAKPLFGSTADVRRGGAGGSSLFDNSDSMGDSGGDFFLTSGGDNSMNKNKQQEYNFRRTDENLFRGLPANKQSSQARTSNLFGDEGKKDNPLFATNKKDSLFSDNDDLDFGGYNPSSFGGGSKKPVRVAAQEKNTWKAKESTQGAGSKKSNVLDDIFGGSKTDTSHKTKQPSIFDNSDDNNSDIFKPASQKPKPTFGEKRTSGGGGFPWDNVDSNNKSDKILPLRPRADHSTIHNKPTVRAISDFDDDLEEVML